MRPQRLLFFLRVATIAISLTTLCAYLSVHAHAQARITVEDARQDQKLDDLAQFRDSQQSINSSTNTKLEGLSEELSAIKGIGAGAVGVLGILQVVQTVLQMKNKP